MQLDPQAQPKPQPMRFKLDAPPENVYKLARHLYTDPSTHDAFKEAPSTLLGQFGLSINKDVTWEFGKHKHGHGDPKPPEHDGGKDGSDAEVAAVCAVIASDVVVGLAICAVVAIADEISEV